MTTGLPLPGTPLRTRPVVGLEILDLGVKEIMQPFQEIGSMSRVLGRDTSWRKRSSNGYRCRSGCSASLPHGAADGIERHEESGVLFFLEFRDAPFGLVGSAFSAQELPFSSDGSRTDVFR